MTRLARGPNLLDPDLDLSKVSSESFGSQRVQSFEDCPRHVFGQRCQSFGHDVPVLKALVQRCPRFGDNDHGSSTAQIMDSRARARGVCRESVFVGKLAQNRCRAQHVEPPTANIKNYVDHPKDGGVPGGCCCNTRREKSGRRHAAPVSSSTKSFRDARGGRAVVLGPVRAHGQAVEDVGGCHIAGDWDQRVTGHLIFESLSFQLQNQVTRT